MQSKILSSSCLAILSSLFVHASAHAQEIDKLIAHEWGTFTSLQGSDGRNMDGMHHEEERLPNFVIGRCGSQVVHGDIKCADFMPRAGTPLAVNQKMETPVIYFYGKPFQKASVSVKFPQGIISQWFPAASGFAPAIGSVNKVGDGQIQWDVEILPESVVLQGGVSTDDPWSFARKVDANVVKVNQSTEKFIFYRGLAQFETPFQVRSDEMGRLFLNNSSSEDIAYALLLGRSEKGFVYQPLGKIAAGTTVTVNALPAAFADEGGFLHVARASLEEGLVQSGLYRKEATAMVSTWEKSYFLNDGLRVLYILPRKWTDELLPLDIKPQPQDLVRTLVGRVEIMPKQEERGLLASFRQALEERQPYNLKALGRMKEAKLRRLHELAGDAEVKKEIEVVLGRLEVCETFPCKI